MEHRPKMIVVKSPRLDEAGSEHEPPNELSLIEVLKLLGGDGHQALLTLEKEVIKDARRKESTK